MHRNILFLIGPKTGVTTGQSIAFNAIVSHNFNELDKVVLNTGGEGVSSLCKIIFVFLVYFKLFFLCVSSFKTKKVIYITLSRSPLGFLREFPIFILAFVFSIPIVNHLHGSDFKLFYMNSNSIMKRLINFCYSLVVCNIILVDGMEEQFSDLPVASKCEIVNNFVSYDTKELPTQNIEEESNVVKFLFLSNLLFAKGIVHLLDAFDCLEDKIKRKIQLHIAGGLIEPDKRKNQLIHQKINKLTLENDNLFYHGLISGEEKMKILASADVFIFPTFYPTEAFPLVLLEAAAAGCFIVTTTHKYIPTIVSKFEANLIDSQNSDAIKEQFVTISDNILEFKSKGERNRSLLNGYDILEYRKKIEKIINDSF